MDETVQSIYRSQKDLGSFSGMVCLYLLVMVFVSIISTFAITLFMYGRYGVEMAEKQEEVASIIQWKWD